MTEIVTRERCPECGETRLFNDFYIRAGHHMRVYVECPSCGSLVARYIIHAYVDPNYSFVSLLRVLSSTMGESGRKTLDYLKTRGEKAMDQFKRVKDLLAASEDKRRVFEIMNEVDVIEDG
jgi:hypothetical protein